MMTLIYMFFCVAFIHSTTFIFTLYRPQDNGTVMTSSSHCVLINVSLKSHYRISDHSLVSVS